MIRNHTKSGKNLSVYPVQKFIDTAKRIIFGLRMRRHKVPTVPVAHVQRYFSIRERKLVVDEKNANLPVIATDLWRYGIWCLHNTTAKKEASWNCYHTKMLIRAWDWKEWHASCKAYKPTLTLTSSALLLSAWKKSQK